MEQMFNTLSSPTDLVSEYIQPPNDPRLGRHKTILEMGSAGERGGARGRHRCGDPPRAGAGLSVLEGEGREEGVRWEDTSGIPAHRSCAVPLATGYPLSPLLNTSARGLSPHSSPLLLPRSSCPLPFIFSLLCLGFFSPSHSIPSRAFFIPAVLGILPHPPPLPPSLISTLQRLVINASFNCHAHFYAH